MGILTSKISEDGSFSPSWLYYRLRPDISGNEINGVGESQARRPKPVYHYVFIKHPWRLWQNSFYFRVSLSLSYMRQFIRALFLRFSPLKPIAKQRSSASMSAVSAELKDYLLKNGAGDVAITRMRPEWIIEGMTVEEPVVVTMAIPMDHDTMMRAAKSGKDLKTGVHIIEKYNDGTALARQGANWLRGQGYHAYGYCGPASGKFTSIPAALAGGLGELGKHGSIINRKYGSNIRIAYILTEAELESTGPDQFGADDFCTNCKVCSNHCPPDAITHDKHLVRGVEKWYVDFDRCVSYFNEAYSCGICLPVCPWSRPGVADKLVVKMARRKERKEQVAVE